MDEKSPRSATTLRPQTNEANKSYYLVTIQHSIGKLYPPKHFCRHITTRSSETLRCWTNIAIIKDACQDTKKGVSLTQRNADEPVELTAIILLLTKNIKCTQTPSLNTIYDEVLQPHSTKKQTKFGDFENKVVNLQHLQKLNL